MSRLVKAYEQLLPRLGDPLESGTLLGPMHNQMGVDGFKTAIEEIKKVGGKIAFGGKVINKEGFFVEPTIVTGLPHDSPVVLRETFAPIVYALKMKNVDEAIKINNSVEQGLSSSIFTQNIANIFKVGASLSCILHC